MEAKKVTSKTKGKFLSNIISNNYESVYRTIKRCPNIIHECIIDDERNPLKEAVYQINNTNMVKLLLDNGADVNACSTCYTGNNGIPPLIEAMYKGDLNYNIVKLLLDHGADVNKCITNTTASPLYLAIQKRHNNIAALLLEYGADVNICYENNSPLQLASKNGYSQLVKKIIECGATIECGDIMNSPLYLATTRLNNPLYIEKKEEYANIIQMLLDHGAVV